MSLFTNNVIFCTQHDHLDVLEGAELVAGDEKSDKARHGGDRARVEVGQGGVRAVVEFLSSTISGVVFVVIKTTIVAMT